MKPHLLLIWTLSISSMTSLTTLYAKPSASQSHLKTYSIEQGRILFFKMTEDSSLLKESRQYFEHLQASKKAHPGLVKSYLGMMVALEARDHIWPWKKLQLAKKSLKILDLQVQAYPESFEIRLLRLKLWQNLPAFFGKDDDIQNELQILSKWFQRTGNTLNTLVYNVALEILKS